MQKAYASAAEIRALEFEPLPVERRDPPYELRPDSRRRGPSELWSRFDHATEALNQAWEGTSIQALADAHGELARILAALAIAVAEEDGMPAPTIPDVLGARVAAATSPTSATGTG
jgi:hypothetical protein